jgi:hypothetical protein
LIVSAVLDENPGLRAEPVGALGYVPQFGVFQAWNSIPAMTTGRLVSVQLSSSSTDKTAMSSATESFGCAGFGQPEPTNHRLWL